MRNLLIMLIVLLVGFVVLFEMSSNMFYGVSILFVLIGIVSCIYSQVIKSLDNDKTLDLRIKELKDIETKCIQDIKTLSDRLTEIVNIRHIQG